MRLALLTAHTSEGDIQHRYMAGRISEAFPDALKGIVVATGVRRTLLQKANRWRARYTTGEIASRIVTRAAHRIMDEDQKRQTALTGVLFPRGEDGRMPRRDLVHLVASHNSQACLDLLTTLKPDVVVVYGTLIIGRKLLACLPRTINLHTGISPHYRGSDTNFWPIYNQEPQYLGATVHRLDPGIDSGPILARGCEDLTPEDNEHILFAKAVKVGADLLCSAVKREYEGTANPLPQDLSVGREYRTVERTLAAELKVRRLLKRGALAGGLASWQEEF